MAGTKGKTGVGKNPNKGRKGQTNNPNGRPIGSKNKIPNQVKKTLEDIFNDNIEQLKSDLKGIDKPEVRAKLLIDIGKLFVPRPLNEQEEKADKIQSEFMKRLFGNGEEE